jgi:hypothetical protein
MEAFTPRHQCMIYKGAPSAHLAAIAAIIQKKLSENYSCLYLNSPPMVAGLRSELAAMDVDVVKEIKVGRLILSSADTLEEDGSFDTHGMLQKLEHALDDALSKGFAGLWASGDMTWEFGNKENLVKLFDYEWQLEKLLDRRPELCGICQYHQDTLPPETLRQALLVHQLIFVNETLSIMNPHFIEEKKLAEKTANDVLFDNSLDDFIFELADRKPETA